MARKSLNSRPGIQNQATLTDSDSQVRKKTTMSSSSDGGENERNIEKFLTTLGLERKNLVAMEQVHGKSDERGNLCPDPGRY